MEFADFQHTNRDDIFIIMFSVVHEYSTLYLPWPRILCIFNSVSPKVLLPVSQNKRIINDKAILLILSETSLLFFSIITSMSPFNRSMDKIFSDFFLHFLEVKVDIGGKTKKGIFEGFLKLEHGEAVSRIVCYLTFTIFQASTKQNFGSKRSFLFHYLCPCEMNSK